MEAISVRKAQALIRSVETLGSVQSLKQCPSAVFSALGEIIGGAVFSLVTINLKTGEVVSEASDNVLMLLEINNRIMEMRSANRAIPTVLPGAKGLIRFTDCTCQWTPLHADGLVPASVRQQTVVTLDIPGYNASVTVNRDTDFSDEETILLSLAVPHLALAHRNLQRLESLRAVADQVIPGPQDLERIGLTPREAEVLHWVMKGKQDAVIAGILKISIRTVHQHIAHILRKLRAESRSSAGYEAMMKLKGLESHPRTG